MVKSFKEEHPLGQSIGAMSPCRIRSPIGRGRKGRFAVSKKS
jgi:hypothetical protein